MRRPGRSGEATARDVALAEAQRSIARLRREKAKVERYRAGKQPEPVTGMTVNQWIGGGS